MSIDNLLGGGNQLNPIGFPSAALTNDDIVADGMNDIYSINNNNWYAAAPFLFEIASYENDNIDNITSEYVMPLPISPSNLTVRTEFATNLISSLYGVIEEHSEVKFYDLAIDGTTGITPKYRQPIQSPSKQGIIDPDKELETAKSNPRTALGAVSDSLFLKGALSSFQAIQSLKQAGDDASDIFNSFGATQIKSGVNVDHTGYVAFHNLYRFLLTYKKYANKEIGQENRKYILRFLNYKDNNKYIVTVNNFNLNRNVTNPFLYNYSISLRGYKLENIQDTAVGVNSLNALLEELGLNKVREQSIFSKSIQATRKAKRAAASIQASALGIGNL